MKKDKDTEKRTHRKEIQFNDAEWDMICSKAKRSDLPVAIYIRNAAMGSEIKAALTQEEKQLYQSHSEISSRYLNNLNQLMRLAHTYGMSEDLVTVLVEFVKRADRHLQGEEYTPIDTVSLEQQLRQQERNEYAQRAAGTGQSVSGRNNGKQHEAELQNLQEEITRLRRVAATYYLYTDEGEKKFLEKFNARIYANDRRDTWFLKVGDNCALELPKFVTKSWLQHECSIAEVYQYWKEHR